MAGYSNPALSNRHMLLARVLPDGLMDSSFGRGGITLANMRSSLGDTTRAVAIDRDGRVVATGTAGYSTGPFAQAAYCATARFSRDGHRGPADAQGCRKEFLGHW